LLGIPCRLHGRRPKKWEARIQKLRKKFVLVPIYQEQLGGTPTPRTSGTLQGTGADVRDGIDRIIAPETGKDVTRFYINGSNHIPEIIGTHRAYLKADSPACDLKGVNGEALIRVGV